MGELLKTACDVLGLPPPVASCGLALYHAFQQRAAETGAADGMRSSTQVCVGGPGAGSRGGSTGVGAATLA